MLNILEKIIEAQERLWDIPREQRSQRICEIMEINRDIIKTGKSLTMNCPYILMSKRFEEPYIIYKAPGGMINIERANLITDNYDNHTNNSPADRGPASMQRCVLTAGSPAGIPA